MSQETITIKFEATGDKALAQSLRGLAKAQNRLNTNIKKTTNTSNKYIGAGARVSRNVKNQKNEVNLLGGAFSVLRSKLLVAAFAYATFIRPLVKSISFTIKASSEFERLQVRLNAMYGSVEKGTRAFKAFNKVAATTPFSLQGVVEAGASLKAFGLNAEQSIKPTADLAAFMGIDVVEASQAMGRAFAGGVGAADVLRERGILNLIKEFKGVEDLTKLTLPEFRKALLGAIQDPTLGIAGSTDKLATTFVGAYSNMQDSIMRLGAEIGTSLMPKVKEALEGIGDLADEVRRFFRLTRLGRDDFSLFTNEIDLFKSTVSDVKDIDELNTMLTKLESQLEGVPKAAKEATKGISTIGEDVAIGELDYSSMEIIFPEVDDASIITIGEQIDGLNNKIEGLPEGWSVLANPLEGVFKDIIAVGEEAAEVSSEVVISIDSDVIKEKIRIITEAIKEWKEAQDKLESDIPKWVLPTQEALKALNIGYSSLSKTAQMYWNVQQEGWEREMQDLKDSDRFKRASSRRQEKMVKDLEDRQRSAKEKAWKQQRALTMGQIVMDTASAVVNALTMKPFWGAVPMAYFVGAMGAAQLAIASSQQMPKFAQGGMIGGNLHSQGGTMIEAERGEFIMSRNAVESVGLETMNQINQGGGTGNINVSFSGNVMSNDFIENEAIPQIKEAIRRGADIGIA